MVGGISPFPAGCLTNQTGSNWPNGPVEPYVAVDPNRPDHVVGVWQQDRWTNGGANGNMAAVSLDGGRTWTSSFASFSICSGGTWDRASDPWVGIAPDGTAHQAALGVNGAGLQTSVLVSRSADGGFTWSIPIVIDRDNLGGDDKESLATDPNDARYVYVVWDRTSTNPISAWFSRSQDYGMTYEPGRIIYDPGPGGYATANQIVVLPDGMLVDVFVLSSANQSNVAVIRSSDHGVTWSTPIVVAADETVGTVDPKTQKSIRSGAGIPSAAVDPASGAIYVVWSDARFSGRQRDGIALAKSLDGGATWSAPVQVNQATNVQAFTPTVAAGPGGVAVTYYDFRQDTPDPGSLLTNYWRVVSTDGGATFRETPVAGPFDLLSAPRVTGGIPFLGDYQSLTAAGNGFLAFFVAANTGNGENPSSVLADSSERAGSTRTTNLRTEVNLHPRPYSPVEKPEPKKRRNLLH